VIFATGMIDVLIPGVIGLLLLVIPVRAKPPKFTEQKAQTARLLYRLAGCGALIVAGVYFLLMSAESSR
jgi:hypothetical protein